MELYAAKSFRFGFVKFVSDDRQAIVADELYSQYACIECTSERAKVKFIVKLITVKYKTMVCCRYRTTTSVSSCINLPSGSQIV